MISAPSASTQSINFTSTAPSGASVGGATYTVSATASSGLAVTFTIAAGSAGVCTLAGSTVSLTGAGTCTIHANQAGDVSYLAAAQVQQSFSIALATQTISFTSTAPSGRDRRRPRLHRVRDRDVGLAGDVRGRPGQRGHLHGLRCDGLDRRRRHLHDQREPGRQRQLPGGRAGPAVVRGVRAIGEHAVDQLHLARPRPAQPSVARPTRSPPRRRSGLTVRFSSGRNERRASARLAGSTVSLTGAGTCTIDANQAGDASYLAAPQVQQSFAVGQRTQTISFTSTRPERRDRPATPTTSCRRQRHPAWPSRSRPTRAAQASAPSPVRPSTIIAAGTCTINADQAGDGTTGSAAGAAVVRDRRCLAPSVQSVNFTSTAPSGASVGGPELHGDGDGKLRPRSDIHHRRRQLRQSAPSSGATVSFTGAGTCTINANQAGNASYLAAPQVQQSFAVALASQTISFTSTCALRRDRRRSRPTPSPQPQRQAWRSRSRRLHGSAGMLRP